MGVEAVIATQVIDTTTVGRSVMTAADAAAARTAIGAGTSSFDGAYSSLTGVPSTFTPSSHTHGNITNAGAIGSTASLPIITGTSGVLEAGSFGTTIGTFCQGNDSRLSDARTPTTHTHPQSDITNLTTDLAAKQATLVSGTNIKTVNSTSLLGSGDITVGLSGTGSVDNALLRADGTGGATLQNSNWIIADNATASPNNTVNHASVQVTGSTTNVSVSIVPKGTGSFSLHVPDGTSTGGNARGANATDLQTLRGSASQVASGEASFLSPGYRNTASGIWSAVVGGGLNVCSGTESFIGAGESNTVSGQFAAILSGRVSQVDGANSLAVGFYAYGRIHGDIAESSGHFSTLGGGQVIRRRLGALTTNNTATVMYVDRDFTIRPTIASGRVHSCKLRVVGVKSDGSAVAEYERRFRLKNVGGTTSLIGSVETIGTDYEDNASTNIAVSADDTNDFCKVEVTGITSETWRWLGFLEIIELAYGT